MLPAQARPLTVVLVALPLFLAISVRYAGWGWLGAFVSSVISFQTIRSRRESYLQLPQRVTATGVEIMANIASTYQKASLLDPGSCGGCIGCSLNALVKLGSAEGNIFPSRWAINGRALRTDSTAFFR